VEFVLIMQFQKKVNKQIRGNAAKNSLKSIMGSPSVRLFICFIFTSAAAGIREEWMWMVIPMVLLIATYKQIIFEILLLIHLVKHAGNKWTWYHKITPFIYLGGIPMESLKHGDILQSHGISVILSINEDYELTANTALGNPIRPWMWKKYDIKFEHIIWPDFSAPDFDTLSKGAHIINEAIENKQKIYVHCKSGMGRSASLVIAYMIKYKQMTAMDAWSKVKTIR
jgi:protein tyrosine phosphatase